jgi:multidrug efflux system outer membrane protein
VTRAPTAVTTLLVVALAACAVGPSYHRPELPIRETYRVEVPAQQGATIADLPWWEVYRDPVLQQLLREALQNNQDLALAAARVQEAGAFVGISKADLWPQLAAQLDASWGRSSLEVFPGSLVPNGGATGRFTAALGLSWELDIWGRVRNSRDAALADLLSTEEGRRSVVLGLVASVASTYWQLRELDLELEIAQRNTAARQGTVDLFQQRSSGGVGNDLEVNQGQADLAVTAAAIPDTERQIALVEHQLCVLLARPPGPIERGEALPTEVAPELPVGVPAALLQRRPDLVAAEQSLIAATHRVGVAVADRLPKLSLVGSVGLDSSSLGNLFKADAATWSIGGSLLAPIFQGGRLAALEDAARARMEQAVAAYRSAVLVALREVTDAAVSYRKMEAVLVQVQLEVKATAAAERLARMRYDGGVASYLEVLDSQRQSYGAELSLARAQLARLLYAVQLYRALGGGWQQPTQGGST